VLTVFYAHAVILSTLQNSINIVDNRHTLDYSVAVDAQFALTPRGSVANRRASAGTARRCGVSETLLRATGLANLRKKQARPAAKLD
jgi:hypothetical protein